MISTDIIKNFDEFLNLKQEWNTLLTKKVE